MSTPEVYSKPRRVLARDVAYRDLRDWILTGALAPEERLHDAALAERLGISRTPVREALQRLEDEELVESSPNRWTRVAPLDPSIANHLYPVIQRLEPLALDLAAFELGDAELEEMERANQRLTTALDVGDPAAASAADVAFHQVFIDRCENPALIAILQEAKAKLQRVELHYFSGLASRETVAEHTAILDALEYGDLPGAASAVETNWRNNQRRLTAVLS